MSDKPSKNNMASRSRWLLLNAKHQKDEIKTIDAWRKVLAYGEGDELDSYEVIRLVELLRKEIKSTERKLSKEGVPEEKYRPHIDNAFKATAVDNVNAQWKNYKQYITGELLVCLSFAEFIIKIDEPEFDEEEVESIRALISELEASIEEGKFSSDLVDFVKDQISLLKRGLHDLSIRGSTAIQKCYIDGIGEFVEHNEVISENIDTEPVRKLRSVWEKMKSATDKAAALNKSIDTWAKLTDKGAALLDQLSNVG